MRPARFLLPEKGGFAAPGQETAGPLGPEKERRMKTVTIYTDGACSGNPGPGGWGAILSWNGLEKELSGGENPSTNKGTGSNGNTIRSTNRASGGICRTSITADERT